MLLLMQRKGQKNFIQIFGKIKAELKTLIEKPYKGKPLQQELQGFYSLRVSRYRAIYTVRTDLKIVEVRAIGHRKDIYELFSELVLNGSFEGLH